MGGWVGMGVPVCTYISTNRMNTSMDQICIYIYIHIDLHVHVDVDVRVCV